MDRQRKIEQFQQNMQSNYSNQVGSHFRSKMHQRDIKEERDFEDVRLRYDKEKEYIERQKQQARDLNSHQLKMQLMEKSQLKQMNDTGTFNKEQAQQKAFQHKKMDQFLNSNRKAM